MINFKIYLRSSSKAMANREKEWNMEKQNFKYLEKEKSFLKYFIVFEGLSFGEK